MIYETKYYNFRIAKRIYDDGQVKYVIQSTTTVKPFEWTDRSLLYDDYKHALDTVTATVLRKKMFERDDYRLEIMTEQDIPKKKSLEDITDEDALEVAKILGGASHISEPNRIIQLKGVLQNRWGGVTNISGISWYRAWKYLEQKGYKIDRE